MKKVMVFLFVIVILMSSIIGCGGKSPPASASVQSEQKEEYNGLAQIYSKIKPLEDKTTLRYASGVAFQLSVPLYIAYYTGGLKTVGIELNHLPSATGPLSVEALNAGEADFIGSGIGGIAVGAASGSAKMLCYLNEDSVIQKFYVAKDSPLAKTQFNPETGFYGTAKDWKGLKVYMPPGTTLQYLMGKAMGKIGLTLQDITPVYMDANNVNTALYAKQGDVWGIWNFLCYASALKEEGYFPVIEGKPVGINLVTSFMTNDKAWGDLKIRAAIEKVLELHFVTLDWMHADSKNMEIAARITTEWGENEGTTVSYEENLAYLTETYFYNLEENYDMFRSTVTSQHGQLVKALDVLMGIMDFYIAQGNYQESDRANMIKNQQTIFSIEGLDAVMKNRN
jgi:ABC-type nitrate/sulfonate/bicarbonate transport system substrate-binding protein